jgi:hypothetical protein
MLAPRRVLAEFELAQARLLANPHHVQSFAASPGPTSATATRPCTPRLPAARPEIEEVGLAPVAPELVATRQVLQVSA